MSHDSSCRVWIPTWDAQVIIISHVISLLLFAFIGIFGLGTYGQQVEVAGVVDLDRLGVVKRVNDCERCHCYIEDMFFLPSRLLKW